MVTESVYLYITLFNFIIMKSYQSDYSSYISMAKCSPWKNPEKLLQLLESLALLFKN